MVDECDGGDGDGNLGAVVGTDGRDREREEKRVVRSALAEGFAVGGGIGSCEGCDFGEGVLMSASWYSGGGSSASFCGVV